MSGTFTPTQSGGQYKKGSFTLDGNTCTGIHVFTTLGKSSQAIVPMVYPVRNDLASMVPSSLLHAGPVGAKINGNVFDYSTGPIGISYEGSNGELFIGKTAWAGPPPISSYIYTTTKFSPTLCVKTDGTAVIRWFSSPTAFQAAITASASMLAGAHALVFNSKCVTDQVVYDSEPTSKIIYDASKAESNTAQPDSRHDFGVNMSKKNDKAMRTLVGHKSGTSGIYVMVCTDSSISIREAANLMLTLGCDYAINLDGAGSVQMRINAGYGPTGVSGKVTSAAGVTLYSGVCAYDK